jgi:hypothetical protein
MLLVAGCNSAQRDSAMRSVRSLQQSGTAVAAEPPATPPQQSKPGEPPKGNPPTAPPPGGPPAGGPPTGGPPTAPPPGGPGAKPGETKAGDKAAADDKSPQAVIKHFLDSDPRDILLEKSDKLKEKETKPWDDSNPDAYIPETGRVDPMTPVRNALPKELLPKRSGDDDSDLQGYLLTTAATGVLEGITQELVCYSVIQIGLTKYARISFNGGKSITTVSLDQNAQQRIRTPEGTLTVQFNVASITTDEVVINVVVSGQDTNVSVQKQMVFIPRNYH